jgi:hypothetical protein
MGTESVPETTGKFHILTRLSAQKTLCNVCVFKICRIDKDTLSGFTADFLLTSMGTLIFQNPSTS